MIMTDFLIRTFIKDSENINNRVVRRSYGAMAGIVGIICNIILCISKLITGILTGAISITADAINNLTDAASSVITLVGFKMAGKSADQEHPYGHGRIEYITGLLISLVIMLVGVELFRNWDVMLFVWRKILIKNRSFLIFFNVVCSFITIYLCYIFIFF